MFKNGVLLVILLFIGIGSVKSQEISKNALGVRFGGGHGIGIEISYQLKVEETRRVEMDFGYRSDNNFKATKFTGIYQWVWEIDKNFNWYLGAGGGIGSWDSKNDPRSDDGFYINLDGDAGIEYNFDFPLLISLDIRPEIGLLGDYDSFDVDMALGVRYQF